jgi:hypothetical protein
MPSRFTVRRGFNATFRRAAAMSSIVGSLLTRWAWIHAGRASTRDPKLALGTSRIEPTQKHEKRDFLA